MLIDNHLFLTISMFSTMLILLGIGAPLAWALLLTGMIFAVATGGWPTVYLLISGTYSSMDNFLMVALPLFIFMGLVLERSGITDKLFNIFHVIFGKIPGGLGVGCISISTIMAAMVGVSGAATTSMGKIALPAMLKRGYDKRLSSGAIMAGGALGFLIPPSILMLIYAFLAQASVGRLFAGGLMPGLLLAAIYSIYILIRCALNTNLGPPLPEEERATFKEKIKSLKDLVIPSGLVFMVLGFLILGITTPSEAGAIGAAGALLCAALYRNLTYKIIKESLMETIRLMGLIFFIMISAIFFSKVYLSSGAGRIIVEWFASMPYGGLYAVAIMLVTLLVLGCFMDDFAITFVTVPIFVPIIQSLGFDPVWFGILFILSMQCAYLSPPFGFNLFYMRAVAPPEVTIFDLYWGALPFIFLQITGIILVLVFPSIALWLPNLFL